MAYVTYNCDGYTGGGGRDLDGKLTADIADKDRGICAVSGTLSYFVYDITSSETTDTTTHPYSVRPADFSSAGVWLEAETSSPASDIAYGTTWSGVTTIPASKNAIYNEMELRTKASSAITDNRLVRGDGGNRGVQETTISVNDSGEMLNTSQPCFFAKPTSNQNNIAAGSYVNVIFGTEIFDVGNNFTSNTFTAPITGKYFLSINIYFENVDSASAYMYLELNTSNLVLACSQNTRWTNDGRMILSISQIVDMDINDTAYIRVFQSAGAVQTDIKDDTFFSGALIC